MSELWERQPYDTDKSWQAFSIYLTLPKRNLQTTADRHYGRPSANKRYIEQWSSDHNWVERVRAYDAYLIEKDRVDFERQKLRARVRRKDVIEVLDGLLVRVMNVHSKALDPATLNQLSSAASKILDQSRQEFDDLPRQRNEHTGAQGGKMQIEFSWEEMIKRDDDPGSD